MQNSQSIFHKFISGKMTPFYDRYYPRLLMYARKLLGSELEWLAEDYVQDAVLDTFQKRETFKDAAQWQAHILTVIRNRTQSALRHLYARRNYEEAPDNAGMYEAEFTRVLIENETLDALYNAIRSLPEDYRELLRMSFEEGLKNSEIAARLGVAEITVKKRKARMLEMLRDAIGGKLDIVTISLILSSQMHNVH